MKFPLILGLAALLSSPALGGEPADLVAGFYAQERSLFDEDVDAFAGDSLGAFLTENAQLAEEQGGMGCLDFDPTLDAQDFDEAELKRTLKLTETVDGEGAYVTASFSLFGEPRTINWTLRKIDGKWRATDIASPESGWRISDMICEAL
jgi:hypothetical protein